MTADRPAQPSSVLELLASPGEGSAEATARSILSAAQAGLNSALDKLPGALWQAATDEVAAAAAGLLDINLADVLVDGRPVVEDGRVVGADVAEATRRVQSAGERVWSRWPDGDWAGRTLDEVAPSTYADFAEHPSP